MKLERITGADANGNLTTHAIYVNKQQVAAVMPGWIAITRDGNGTELDVQVDYLYSQMSPDETTIVLDCSIVKVGIASFHVMGEPKNVADLLDCGE